VKWISDSLNKFLEGLKSVTLSNNLLVEVVLQKVLTSR